MADNTAGKKPFLERHKTIYGYLFAVWYWYADKVLRIPFTVSYMPLVDGEQRLQGITFSWSLQYSQQLKDNWDLQERYNQTAHQLQTAARRIAELTDELERSKK